MGNISRCFDDERLSHLPNISQIVNFVGEAHSFEDAIEALASHIASDFLQLLAAATYDRRSIKESTLHFSNLDPQTARSWRQLERNLGSPLARQVLETEQIIDVVGWSQQAETLKSEYGKIVGSFGFEHVVAIPILTADCLFLFLVGFDDPPSPSDGSSNLQDMLANFVIANCIRFPYLLSSADTNDKKNVLTRREVECLAWTAKGKTSYEISAILDLSEHTINAYLSSACAKLEASNRTHAIAKAITQRLLPNLGF